MKKTIVFILMFIMSSSLIFSQEAPSGTFSVWSQHVLIDGVKVSHIWEQSDKKDANSLLQLCLIISNANSYSVKMEFTIVYYFKGEIHEETLIQKICLKAGKHIKGGKNGLCWISEELSNEEIQSSDFKWEMGEFSIKEVESCK